MPIKRIDQRRIRLHQAYSVEEAARALGKHKHTIRNWIEAGLPTVDGTRPLLVHGDELRAFLEARRKVVKRPCPPGTIYCFKCRQPREPARAWSNSPRATTSLATSSHCARRVEP